MQTTTVVGTPIFDAPVVAKPAPAAGAQSAPVAVVAQPAMPPRPAPLEQRTSTIEMLLERGWPPGLTAALADSTESFPVRFVIVDNSGSMQSRDGSRLVKAPGGAYKTIAATRWAELGDVVLEMADVWYPCSASNHGLAHCFSHHSLVPRSSPRVDSASINSTTHFHLLNRCHLGQFFTVADDGSSCVPSAGAPTTSAQLKAVMATSPTGTTPLTEAVQQVARQIAPSAAKLVAHGQKAVVVLATDGLPNDPPSFVRALQELQRMPVWLVVRLCTDEESVVDYWSALDKQLEAPLETLDDVAGEAKEVHAANPWLAYAPALHLARTMGLQDKLFDLLDEQPLLPSQAKQLCERILGCAELPEPEVDPDGFRAALKGALGELPAVHHPMRRGMAPWVDVHLLMRSLKGGANGGGFSCAIA